MEKILIVDGVTKDYPGRKAVEDLSFEVHQGSIHGFLGPNGAGKSTTMRLIAGLLPATAGTISLFGKRVDAESLDLKNQIGLLPENPPLFLDMTVEAYLLLVAKLHGVRNPKPRVAHVIEKLSLGEVQRRLIGNLSRGYRQRVGLAQAIVYDAPFLMLDEPTNGLDPQSVVELREFIKQLAVEKTILFSSHVLSEVEQLCDHITIIHHGKIRASGNLREIHHKFRQGLVLRVGLGKGQKLPDLSTLGAYEVSRHRSLPLEEEYHLAFSDDRDCRAELSQLLLGQGCSLLTLSAETPELEDIFLHMTEPKQ